METFGVCEQCGEECNGEEKKMLICPGCENYERCDECFKENKYRCGECYSNWGYRDRDGKIIGYDQLVSNTEAPPSEDIYTI